MGGPRGRDAGGVRGSGVCCDAELGGQPARSCRGPTGRRPRTHGRRPHRGRRTDHADRPRRFPARARVALFGAVLRRPDSVCPGHAHVARGRAPRRRLRRPCHEIDQSRDAQLSAAVRPAAYSTRDRAAALTPGSQEPNCCRIAAPAGHTHPADASDGHQRRGCSPASVPRPSRCRRDPTLRDLRADRLGLPDRPLRRACCSPWDRAARWDGCAAPLCGLPAATATGTCRPGRAVRELDDLGCSGRRSNSASNRPSCLGSPLPCTTSGRSASRMPFCSNPAG